MLDFFASYVYYSEGEKGETVHLFKFIRNFLRRFRLKYLPTKLSVLDLSEIRQKNSPLSRQVKEPLKELQKDSKLPSQGGEEASCEPSIDRCPYCSGKDFIKSGKRKKKYEVQQRYLCNDCKRLFVAQNVKGKSFPLKLILEGLSYYNRGFTMVDTCTYLKEKFGIEVKDSTLSDWVKEFEPLCRYSRLRPYGLKLYSPNQVIQTVHLYHHQVYPVRDDKLCFTHM